MKTNEMRVTEPNVVLLGIQQWAQLIIIIKGIGEKNIISAWITQISSYRAFHNKRSLGG